MKLFAFLFACQSLSWAAEDSAVEDGRDALAGRTSFPWYDREKDAPRPLRLGEDGQDAKNRSSNWQQKSSTPSTTTAPGGQVSLFGGLLQVLGLLALVSVLIAVAVLIARAFLRNEVTETGVSRVVETSHETDRVENLPFQLKRPTGNFLSEARRLYEAGQYSEAILYLYSHMLVQLDRQHVIRLAKGKTNRQYLRETRQRPLLYDILEITMVGFEDVFFGHHQLSREQFEESWKRIGEFEAELTKLERAAA